MHDFTLSWPEIRTKASGGWCFRLVNQDSKLRLEFQRGKVKTNSLDFRYGFARS